MTTPPAPRTPSAARCEGARPDDAPAAGTAPDAQGTVAVLLPDGWTLIELQDDDARLRTVDALVHRRLGKVPELAPLRASVLAELLDRTLTAARAGGVLMALADGELAVPASLTVYRVAGSLDARGRAAMVRILTTDEPGHALDIGEGAAGVVLRRVRPVAATTEITGDRAVPTLLVDYWIEPTPGAQLVYLVFSSPLVEQRDALLRLFDTIVSSVRVLVPSERADERTTED